MSGIHTRQLTAACSPSSWRFDIPLISSYIEIYMYPQANKNKEMPSVEFCYGVVFPRDVNTEPHGLRWKGCHVSGCRTSQPSWNAYALLLSTFNVLPSLLMSSFLEARQSSDENHQTPQSPTVGKTWTCSQEDV